VNLAEVSKDVAHQVHWKRSLWVTRALNL
jgi:hypothetical protein